MGLDRQHEPAYGLIFGAFIAAGACGGLVKAITVMLSPLKDEGAEPDTVTIEGEGEVRPMAVDFLAAVCYMLSTYLFTDSDSSAFTYCALGLLWSTKSSLEYVGVIRFLYIPSDCRASSIMTLPSIIVNVAVSIGVASTNVLS
jgi:hypothetical protein